MFLLPILIILLFLSLFLFSFLPFYNPKHKEDPYDIPTTGQYAKHAHVMSGMVDTLRALPYEQVYITSRDGLRLAARFYFRKEGAPVKIEFHGYRSAATRDFSGALEMDSRMGFNVLLVDQRAHGLSDGHVICFGVKERYDVVDWCKYAVERFGPETQILLSGISMGAATVLMASDLEDLPDNVKGIIADCGYSSPEGIIKKVCDVDVHIPSWLIYPFVKTSTRLLGKFDLESVTAVEAVKHTRVPLFIVHGSKDHYVPCSMAYELKEAAGDMAELHIFPGSGHVLSYLDDTPRYHQLAGAFCDVSVKSKSGTPGRDVPGY